MNAILNIPLQKLFFLALVLKLSLSFCGWYFDMPWSLGFALPLCVMAAYVFLGSRRSSEDITDEKFADTCYYLGFIFTITSIIFSLFDLPQIGTKIQEIAVRFGAAMVSTVMGLAVRVYLVSFKQEFVDAITDAEDAAVETSRKFTEQLRVVLERLEHYELQVDEAARSSVERVNVQVESLTKNYADKLSGLFFELSAQNQNAFNLALDEVRIASGDLAESVAVYSQALEKNLGGIEEKVGVFADAVTSRLKTTEFPDDFFATRLEAPLSQLTETVCTLSEEVSKSSAEVTQTTKAVAAALKKLRDKADISEESLSSVLRLTEQQQVVLDAGRAQIEAVNQITETLDGFGDVLTDTLEEIRVSNANSSRLTNVLTTSASAEEQTRSDINKGFTEVIERLKLTSAEEHPIARRLDSCAQQLGSIMNELGNVVSKINESAGADSASAVGLATLNSQTSTAVANASLAVEQIKNMVAQLSELGATLNESRTFSDGSPVVSPAG